MNSDFVQFDFSWLSIIPPLTAILMALLTRQVIISLLLGIILGWIIVNNGNPLTGLIDTMTVLISVFAVADQARVIVFTLLMGSLLFLMSRAGGVVGFVQWMQRKQWGQTRRSAQLLAWCIGLGVYIESTITCLVVGTVARPLFDRQRISREKLAYICDSTASPVCLLIPFNGWGATILGLLAVQASHQHLGDFSPLTLFIMSIPLNFYVFTSVLMVLWVCWRDWHIGPMKVAEQRAMEQGQCLCLDSDAQLEQTMIQQPMKAGLTPGARFMIVPLTTMMLMVIVGIVMTGVIGAAQAGVTTLTAIECLRYASGSTAVLWGVSSAIVMLTVMLLSTRRFSLAEIISNILQGASGMIAMATLMLLAFAIGATCDALNTGPWIAQSVAPYLTPALIAPLVFCVSCLIAFATGTSWGTFAIMIPLALPLAHAFQLEGEAFVSLPLVLSAVLGGGVFGDHCSPISDTTVLASMASCCDHIDHVRTQLPYALIAASLSLFGYFAVGLML